MISDLAGLTMLSPNHSDGRGGERVCKFTPHYMGGDCSVEVCGEIFQPVERQASSNYGIGSDGRVACYVDEDDRAWTSASGWNDRQAVTVEVANLADGSVTDAAWASLVALGADVCRRHGFRLEYTGGKNGSLTEHRMFAETDCPGPWLHANMGRLAREVNALLDGGEPQAPATDGAASCGGKQSGAAAPSAALEVDGWWGKATTAALQRALGCVADGEVWHQWAANVAAQPALTSGWVCDGTQAGSPVVRSLQAHLGMPEAERDGIMGPGTVRALQRAMGTPVDGVLDGPSPCVMELQRRLNAGAV